MNIYIGNQPINFIVTDPKNIKTIKHLQFKEDQPKKYWEYMTEDDLLEINDNDKIWKRANTFDNIRNKIIRFIDCMIEIMEGIPAKGYIQNKKAVLQNKFKFIKDIMEYIKCNAFISMHGDTMWFNEMEGYLNRYFMDYTSGLKINMEVATVLPAIKELFGKCFRTYTSEYDQHLVPKILNLVNPLVDEINDL